MTTRTCPNAATCPSATLLDDGTWLIVGRQITDAAAREHGGNPAPDEAAVIVPQQVIDDAISGPLRDEITRLKAEREQVADGLAILRRDYAPDSKAWHALDDACALIRAIESASKDADATNSENGD